MIDQLTPPENFESKCRVCSQPFVATRFEVYGATLTTTICNSCSIKLERKEAERIENERKQRAMGATRIRDEQWEKMCPKEFRLVSESGGNTQLAKLELAQPKSKELLAWTGPRGIIIRGDTGKCKTRAMWRLLRRLFIDRKSLVVLTAAQFDRQCRDAGGTFTLTSWFERLASCDVFAIDDLGKHPWTPATEATWFDLVDQRGREEKPIIITTNDTGETLASRMAPERADALVRRLREYCDVLIFT
jgi:DNA replication protein DnaC